MVDEEAYPTNGEPKAEDSVLEEADALLLYRAKQNVGDKKNLVKHVVAYIVAWPILGLLFVGIISEMRPYTWSWWRIRDALVSIELTRPQLSADYQWAVNESEYHWAVDELAWNVGYYFDTHYMVMGKTC